VLLAISDVQRAEAFYRDTLGIKHLYTFGPLAFFDCHGTRLMLSASDEGANRERMHSVLYFEVPDINAARDELVARGVSFVHEPHLIHRHEDGTEEWMAFFNDPDENLLAIMSRVRP
jgi:catechol 2,3-dioxygenase-like lactoylglutathione lyase family enzyme